MRIIQATLATLFICAILFLTVKFWGRSQTYSDYDHPILKSTDTLIFKKPKFSQIDHILLNTTDNVYLDIANTKDQKVVIVESINNQLQDHTKDIRNKLYSEVESHVLLLGKYKNQLKNRVIIFNIIENAITGHLIFIDEIKSLGLEDGQNFIITTPYEVLAKSIKEQKPTYLFGTTQPEILKIKAMESLGLIEATTLRADVLIYPLTYYKHPFYTQTLLEELTRRHKKIIVGPISSSEIEQAKSLAPLGIITQD